MTAYKDDLAYIHDVGFGSFARGATPGLLEILRRRGLTKGLVVDLGCGSGIWARALVDAGYDVLGIDISAAMIEMARRRVPEGDFRTGSFLQATLPPCEAVTALGEIFNYLFDSTNSLRALGGFFRRVYDALRPGGLLIFDVAEPGRGRGPRQRHFEGEDWTMFTEYEEEEKSQRLTRRIVTFRKQGRLYRRDEEVHRLQLYHGADVAAALRRVGFRVRIVRGYGQQRFPRAYVGFLARKP